MQLSAQKLGAVTETMDGAEAPNEILTIEELAEYLRIPKSTLYKLVREGSVRCQKVGKHRRFHKDAIDKWLKRQPKSARSRKSHGQ